MAIDDGRDGSMEVGLEVWGVLEREDVVGGRGG